MTSVELDDVQDILLGYPGLPHACYLFLRIDEPARARAWLSRVVPEVSTGQVSTGQVSTGQRRDGGAALNIGLTWVGLAALGVGERTLRSFPEEFQNGMAGRAKQLGDFGTNDRGNWESGGPGTTEVHAVLLVHADTRERLEARCRSLREALRDLGQVVYEQDGCRLRDSDGTASNGQRRKPRAREHFGFVDGISQPVVEGIKEPLDELLPGQGVREPNGTWRPLRTGEIVLGYPDEEGVLPASPTPAELGRNGTYLVYRKLHQDVAAFRRLAAEQGKHYPGGSNALVAKMVGRTPNGVPLARPERNDTTAQTQHGGAFTYADDPDGRRCPIGSHIRRANPRDGFAAHNKLVARHRMLRRGIPYGPKLPADELQDDGQQRGLLFICLCASIARQFEFVQAQWLNDGNGLGLGSDQDPLLSNSSSGTNLTIPGDQPWLLSPVPPLVTVRGGEYFFLPGRRALARLANPDLFQEFGEA